MLIAGRIGKHWIVTFAPLLLAGVLIIFATFYLTVKVFKSLIEDREINILSQRKLAELRKDFGTEAIRRIELSINLAYDRAFANPLPPQQGFTVVGLTSKPWYEISDLPNTKLLEDNYEIVQKEVLQVMDSKTILRPYNYPGVAKHEWDSIDLVEKGKKVESNYLHFPKTVELLEQLSKHARFGSVALSVVKPGKVIKPHRDPGSLSIICQLGLVIPEKCGIRVGGESRTWEEGKCLFFDPSYEHTVWNYSDSPRAVLLVVFWKPELTALEMNFLHMLTFGEWPEKETDNFSFQSGLMLPNIKNQP
jgi:quercetin dioxygenase-like cupin family protein